MNPPDKNNSPLMHIREGMEVYDVEGDHIGTVEEVYFGSGGVTARRPDAHDNDVVDVIQSVFGNEYNMPEELKERLIRKGYVRINGAGLLAHDRFIMPQQIASVSGDKVMLRAEDDDLVDDNVYDED